MKKSRFIAGLSLCMLTCSFALTGCNETVENQDKEPIVEETEDFSDVKTEYYLDNGYYTIGVDIPAGVCDIYATMGTGSILYSADGTADTYNAYEDDLNQSISNLPEIDDEISDYTLKEGYTIHISGNVRVKVDFSRVTSNYTGREYEETESVTLESGAYTAGTDFEAGVYTITAVEGNGSISSSNFGELGIDEMFGVYDGTQSYVSSASNVTLNAGDTLELTDVTVELVKVK